MEENEENTYRKNEKDIGYLFVFVLFINQKSRE